VVDVDNQSGDAYFLGGEETHVDGLEFSALDYFLMRWEKDQVFFESQLDVEQEKGLFHVASVDFFIYFQQTVPPRQSGRRIVYPKHEVLVKRIYFDLYVLFAGQEKLHFQNLLQI
jgi:hypothetical protein